MDVFRFLLADDQGGSGRGGGGRRGVLFSAVVPLSSLAVPASASNFSGLAKHATVLCRRSSIAYVARRVSIMASPSTITHLLAASSAVTNL